MFIKDPMVPILHQGIIGHQETTHHRRLRRGTAILLRLPLLGPLLIRATSIMITLHHYHHRSTPNTTTTTMRTVVDVAHFSRAAWLRFAVAVCWRSAAAAFRLLNAKQMQLLMLPYV